MINTIHRIFENEKQCKNESGKRTEVIHFLVGPSV